MNPSYISSTKTICIPDMSNSFLDSSMTSDQWDGQFLLTEDSLKELFYENYSFLCASAFRVLEDEDVSKDMVQNFFLRCWEKRSTMKIQGDFKNYAYRAIRNASLNYLKRGVWVEYNSDLIRDAAEILEHSSEAEMQAIEDERERALWETIDLLPPKRKQIFVLSQKEGLTYCQIAEELDISVNTVKTQIKLSYVFLRRECQWLSSILIWFFL